MIQKFRVWVKPEKRMIETSDILSIDYEYEEVETQFVDGLPEDRDLENFPFEDVILMQSTGRFDKNGKEIFEGDILKVRDKYEDTDGSIEAVSYSEAQASFITKDIEQNIYRLCYTLMSEVEVIGNIYQDYELLEVV